MLGERNFSKSLLNGIRKTTRFLSEKEFAKLQIHLNRESFQLFSWLNLAKIFLYERMLGSQLEVSGALDIE